VGRGVVVDEVHIEMCGHRLVDDVEEATELLGTLPWVRSAITLPDATSKAA
jgi:hypothetical protein